VSDLTSIEQRFRMANPVPDPSNPPVPASSAAAALLDINARSIEMQTQVQPLPDQPLTESPAPKKRMIPALAAAAVVIVVIILGVALFNSNDETGLDIVDQPDTTDVDAVEPETPEPAEVVTDGETSTDAAEAEPEAEPQADPIVETLGNEALAGDFIEARAAFDGEAVRALVADDATISRAHEWVDSADDYLVLDDWERAIGMSFLDAECEESSPGRVRCTYTMETAMTRALGVGPYANSFLFEIADGEIQQVNHVRVFRGTSDLPYFTEVFFVAFTPWLDANHPGDQDLMFSAESVDNVQPPLITPESILLWEVHVEEFVTSLTEGA
jgi:hypothetical protein